MFKLSSYSFKLDYQLLPKCGWIYPTKAKPSVEVCFSSTWAYFTESSEPFQTRDAYQVNLYRVLLFIGQCRNFFI
jgi:hypothetical protein